MGVSDACYTGGRLRHHFFVHGVRRREISGARYQRPLAALQSRQKSDQARGTRTVQAPIAGG